jgi:lipid II:glycine glycyltransferase (peptidoglycan interpeptide bridge formation enzyme)
MYNNLKGSDYIYYASIIHAAANGIDIINLGGGTSTNKDDSLFRFKKKFSNNYKEVYAGKKTIDAKAYNSIIEQWENRYPHLKEKYKNFFLKYRQTE